MTKYICPWCGFKLRFNIIHYHQLRDWECCDCFCLDCYNFLFISAFNGKFQRIEKIMPSTALERRY
jgi:hypothetical protein